jgi:hypothetical protein
VTRPRLFRRPHGLCHWQIPFAISQVDQVAQKIFALFAPLAGK